MELPLGPTWRLTHLAAELEVEFVEQYLNQPLFHDVDLQARRMGWMFHTFLGYGTRALRPILIDDDPRTGVRQWLWADAVYIKHPLSFEGMSADQLLKLAVLLHDLYGSYDFAYRLLWLYSQLCGGKIHQAYLKKVCDSGASLRVDETHRPNSNISHELIVGSEASVHELPSGTSSQFQPLRCPSEA